MIIPKDFTCSQEQREIFKKLCGHKFRFLVPFQEWLHENKGKATYIEAGIKYLEIVLFKKSGGKYPIQPQFKYNQFMRDFFTSNPGATRQQCLDEWKKNCHH
jgi:hypothetical protein